MSEREQAEGLYLQADELTDLYIKRFALTMALVASAACLVAWAWGAGLL